MLSLKSLGLRGDKVHCFTVAEAPPELQQLNLNGKASLIWVVPTKFQKIVVIASMFSEKIRGANVYVS